MYCLNCDKDIFGGSICHLCGKALIEKEEKETTESSPETSHLRKPLGIRTRKKSKITKEFGQTLLGRVGRIILEIAIFCAAFWVLSWAVVQVSNWLSVEMALPGEPPKHVSWNSDWMRYFRYIGFAAVVFFTVKFRFKPGK